MAKHLFTSSVEFQLESGETLPEIEIAYHTYGTLNDAGDNVVWVCHALTANSDPLEWWSGLFGTGRCFDPANYFIVCANVPGSCYGSSGPLSTDPRTGKKYYSRFPRVTIRDMVKAHQLLQDHLGVKNIFVGIGGSMGAYQLLEWAVDDVHVFDQIVLVNTGARESAWGISIHTAQRMAIEADASWKDDSDNAGMKGLRAARAIGMLTYRSYKAFDHTQTDPDNNKTDHFKASSYIEYQGDKLVKRFNAQSYWILTKAMDSHNLARNRGDIKEVLKTVETPALVIGVSSDFLCPNEEQRFLAEHLGTPQLEIIDSIYGHDGFLVETEKLSGLILDFLETSRDIQKVVM